MSNHRPITPTKSGPVNVAFYIRVSSDKQAKMTDSSLDTQLDRLNEEVRHRGAAGFEWVVTERLIEGEKDGVRHGKSGKNAKRPMYQRMLELARARLVDVVMVTRLDRVSRSLADFVHLVEELQQYGVQIVSLKEQIDLTTPAGRLQANMLMSLAQYERELVSTRVLDKMAWRAEKGLPLGRSAPGYKLVDRMFVPNPPYDGHVTAADAIYLERHSADAVVKQFARLGYRTSTGALYNKPTILRMLRNPVYAAKLEHRGSVYDAQWKPIRSWETHQKVQALLDQNDRSHHGGERLTKDHVYLLQSLLRCGLCGRRMTPRPGTGRNGLYAYYQCGGAEKSLGLACPRVLIPAKAVDTAVVDYLKRLPLDPDHIAALAKRANAQTSETLRKLLADRDRVKAQFAEVMPKLKNIVKAIERGIDTTTMHESMRALESERAELEATEARLKIEIAAEETQEIIAHDVMASLTAFRQIVETGTETPERLKMLLPRFVAYIVWHEHKKGEGQVEVALYQEQPALEAALVAVGSDASAPGFAGADHFMGRRGLEPLTFCVSTIGGVSRRDR
jgi:DNA invertase Pin-like site-specific DNA recombinase